MLNTEQRALRVKSFTGLGKVLSDITACVAGYRREIGHGSDLRCGTPRAETVLCRNSSRL